jgi:menaquinone-dependent protoporphyrinogen oxidase
MKTLIIYGTHKGCTRKCAALVREQIGNAEMQDVARLRKVDLNDHDTIVLGTSVWAGKIHPKVRRFVERNLQVLLGKRVGLFICSGDEKTDYFVPNYPAELMEHAEVKAHFGGELDIKDYGPFMRFVLKKAAGVTESYSRLKPEAIARFSSALRA